jgi:hypothetical protein
MRQEGKDSGNMAITLDTVFKIGAVFTGAAAINQAQQAITGLEQKGLLAGLSLKKMVVGLSGLAATYLTVDKLTGFINSSVDAARKAKAAYQGISDSLSKIPQMQKLGTTAIKDQTDKLNELSKSLEKVGGLASETLAASFSKLVDIGFSPAKIKAMSGAFEDVIVRVKGIKATTEDATQVAEQFGNAIKTGGADAAQQLVQMGVITADQVDQFNSLKTAGDRYSFTLQEMQKHVGDTAAAMKTQEGIQIRLQNAWKDVKVAIGTPFMQAQDTIASAMVKINQILLENADKISSKVTPIISKMSDAFTGWIQNLVDNLDKYTPTIDKFGTVIGKAFDFVIAHGTEVSAALGAITGALAVFGTAGIVAGNVVKITSAIQGLAAAWKILSAINFGAVIGLMTNPATWIVIGIAALAAAIYLLITHWDDVKKAATAAWNAIVLAWGNASAWVTANVVKPLQDLFGGLVQKIQVGDIWGAFLEWTNITQKIDDFILQKIIELFRGLVGLIGNAIGDLWPAFGKWAEGIGDWVNKNLIDPIVEAFKGLPKLIGDALGGLGASLIGGFQQGWNQFTGWAKGIPVLGNLFGGKGGTAGEAAGWAAPTGAAGAASSAVGSSGALNIDATSAAIGAATPVIRAMGFGPAAGDTGHAANYSAYGSGPADSSGKHLLTENDIAVSKEFLSKFPMGSFVDIIKNGKVLYAHQKVADTSWFNNPIRPTGGFEQRHVDEIPGGAQLVRSAAFGGLFSSPALTTIAERVPEMAIPIEGTSRSRGLLGMAAGMIGGGGMSGGGGGIHLSMSAPITINGVPASEGGAIAREVEKALQDPIRSLLDKLKKAKLHEQRLSYA